MSPLLCFFRDTNGVRWKPVVEAALAAARGAVVVAVRSNARFLDGFVERIVRTNIDPPPLFAYRLSVAATTFSAGVRDGVFPLRARDIRAPCRDARSRSRSCVAESLLVLAAFCCSWAISARFCCWNSFTILRLVWNDAICC